MVTDDRRNRNLIALEVWVAKQLLHSLGVKGHIDGLSLGGILPSSVVIALFIMSV